MRGPPVIHDSSLLLQVLLLSNVGTCACVYTAAGGDTCSSIANQKGISLDYFLALNPSINSNCDNLQIGQVNRLSFPYVTTPRR